MIIINIRLDIRIEIRSNYMVVAQMLISILYSTENFFFLFFMEENFFILHYNHSPLNFLSLLFFFSFLYL